MTPREFFRHMAGVRRRDEMERRKTAWSTAWLVNCWAKDPVSIEKILGESGPDMSEFQTREEFDAFLRERKAKGR